MESVGILVALAAMCLSLGLILIPAVPVSALVWFIAVLYGVFTGFERFTLVSVLITTLFMGIGGTSGLWMPFLGYRGGNTSCMGMVAFFIGMIAGSALIPIPFLGTIIGGVVAVIIVEYSRLQDLAQAVQNGRIALRTVLLSMLMEFVFSVAIIGVYIVSIYLTR